MEHIYNDGGRKAAGYKGSAGDCVVRAIAIALELPYKEVYDELHQAAKDYASNHRDKVARSIKKRGATPRNGAYREVYEEYLKSKGWKWKPTMGIGTGCQVHLRKDELPSGRIIVSLSKHIAAVIDGVLHDTHIDDRDGTRCVYGYYKKV